MKNLMKKIRKNNKGFTLVELIIVVAIIAVLSAVAAPQYIKYVERSRQGVDASTLEEVRHAVEVEAAILEDGKDGTVSIAGTDGTISATDFDQLDLVKNVVGEKVELKSKAAKDYTWIIAVASNGTVTWQNTAAAGADPAGSAANIASLQGGTLAEVTT